MLNINRFNLRCQIFFLKTVGRVLLFPSRGFNAVKSGSEVIHPECKNCIFAKECKNAIFALLLPLNLTAVKPGLGDEEKQLQIFQKKTLPKRIKCTIIYAMYRIYCKLLKIKASFIETQNCGSEPKDA